jgi:diacylglycerol kinase family enzyme
MIATIAAGSAGAQARQAAERGAEVVFACGGDGTVHEVIQGLVNEAAEPAASLGIVPLGSANALARHLGLSLDPVEAALQQIHGKVQTIPVGKVEYGADDRYFLVMAGVGPDAALVYKLLTGHKSGLGRWAYYLHAARLFATRRFRAFELQFTKVGNSKSVERRAVCVMAVRVGDLGGLFCRLVNRNASVHQPHLQLVIVRPPAVVTLPLWFVSGWLNLTAINPWVDFAEVTEFSCKPFSGVAPHLQADGEWLGRIPMRVSLVPNEIRILLPD